MRHARRLVVLASLVAVSLVGAGTARSDEIVPHDRTAPQPAPSWPVPTFTSAATLPRPVAAGDLFSATPTGSLNWYGPDGTFVAELATGLSSLQTVAADPSGQLWAVDRTRPMTLARIDAAGALTTQTPVGQTITPSTARATPTSATGRSTGR